MASCMSRSVCIAFVVLACVSLGASLSCYQCNSTINGDCDDVRGKKITEESCDTSKLLKAFPNAGSKHVCVLHREASKIDRNINVVRGCAPELYCERFPHAKQCLVCETNLCNSSTALLPSIVLSIVGIVCTKMYFYCKASAMP